LVKKALWHVAQKLVLDGHPDPRKASSAQQSLDLPISRPLKSFGNRDPPAEPKLAIPISTITTISKNYRWKPHLDAMAFFYLLQVGEYTSPATSREKTDHTPPTLRHTTMAEWHCPPTLQWFGKPSDCGQCDNLHR
jgi:hypothetical protein